MKIYEHEFRFACRIDLSLNSKGLFLEEFPCIADNRVLHKYGKGPFSKFRIPPYLHDEGVHILMVDNKIKYIGGCRNISDEYNLGFGRIVIDSHPFKNGPEDYCRINTLITEKIKSGSIVELWFMTTTNHHRVKSELLRMDESEWNLRH